MTGRLGVFRISKCKAGKAGAHSGNLAGAKRWICCWWDTTDHEQAFGRSGQKELWQYTAYGTAKKSQAKTNLSDVFYLPVRIMDSDPDVVGYKQPTLTGLLLQPTGKTNGQFRRVGVFEGSKRWGSEVVRITGKTDILDSKFFVEKRGNGDYTVTIV